MKYTMAVLALGAALLAAGNAGIAGDLGRVGAQAMTKVTFTPDGKPEAPRQTRSGETQLAAGAECPTGSGKYCSDEHPYCCPGVNVDPYCATNVNGCTK